MVVSVEQGIKQPPCTVASTTNMVSCANWHESLVMPITSAFFPGDYLIKLVAGPRAASYVLLTVRDPSSTAAYVVMNRSLVEQGWNTYGGYSYYAGSVRASSMTAPIRRAIAPASCRSTDRMTPATAHRTFSPTSTRSCGSWRRRVSTSRTSLT